MKIPVRGRGVTGARSLIGSHDVLFITLDTLRYDVARREADAGGTPFLTSLLPGGEWEERHTPGSFTFAAHQAFFSGFLPTPVAPGPHPRLFALAFPGSETTGPETCVLDAPDLITGLRDRGYRSVCIGGVGFFNGLTSLGKVLPSLFEVAHWSPELGVTDPESTRHQVTLAIDEIESTSPSQRLVLFLNVSAIHQPNCCYLPGSDADTLDSHAAALRYVDRQMRPLFEALRRRGPLLAILCSDHGTAYGEDGYRGHRLAHPCVWTVPYAAFTLPAGDV